MEPSEILCENHEAEVHVWDELVLRKTTRFQNQPTTTEQHMQSLNKKLDLGDGGILIQALVQ